MQLFELFSSGIDLYDSLMAPVSSAFGLTAVELSILLFLANNPEYDTARDIVNKRHLAKSHVSVSLRDLEERKFLKKEHRNGDNRTAHIVLLPASSEAIRKGQEEQLHYVSLLTKGFTDAEIETLRTLIGRIADNIGIAPD